VTEVEGTTRDRQYGTAEWNGREFSVIDTGGWVVDSEDVFEEEINKQVMTACEEADLLLFVTDINTGVTDLDMRIAGMLRRAVKPVIVAANKADTFDMYAMTAEFYGMGLGDPVPVSAVNGSGTGDLLDVVVEKLPDGKIAEMEADIPRIAIVGRPNAGKSSLLNAFTGEERNIVTEIAGTTRDSINTVYDRFGLRFCLVDTAGIRRKNRVNEDLEYYSVIRSIRSIEESDVCILMIDATRGIEAQDMNIFSIIQKNRKGIVIAVNKWDLVEEKSQAAVKTFENAIRERTAPFSDIPVVFSSAVTKQRIFKILETAKMVYDNRRTRIATHKLNEVLLPVIENTPPPVYKGKVVKIKYIMQLPNTAVPGFVFFCNLPQWVKEPYKRFLENQIRKNWNFKGTPVNIFMREK
jgi:GTP-binding protein